jgi:hypothetical protein
MIEESKTSSADETPARIRFSISIRFEVEAAIENHQLGVRFSMGIFRRPAHRM